MERQRKRAGSGNSRKAVVRETHSPLNLYTRIPKRKGARKPKSDLDAWIWEEPSEKEFEERRKKETFYKIYWFEDLPISGKKEFIAYKFWAKSDKEAYGVLKKFRKSKLAYPGETYYYSTSGYHVDSDGKRYDSVEEIHKKWLENESFWEKVLIWFSVLGSKFSDAWFGLEDFFRRAFTGHSVTESWDPISHFFDDVEHNLPILIKNLHGYPGGEGMTEKKWADMLYGFLVHVRLYRFYDSFGIIDENDKEEVAFREEWGHTIPYKKGTNREIDHVKLESLKRREWNAIWSFLRKWGSAMWD